MSDAKVLTANCSIESVKERNELHFEESTAPSWVVDICITTTGVWFRPAARKGFLKEFRKKTGLKKAHFEGNILKW